MEDYLFRNLILRFGKLQRKGEKRNEYKDYDAVREKMGVRAVVQIGMLAAVA